MITHNLELAFPQTTSTVYVAEKRGPVELWEKLPTCVRARRNGPLSFDHAVGLGCQNAGWGGGLQLWLDKGLAVSGRG